MSELTYLVTDLETTSLDEHNGLVLEVGVIGLDAKLHELFRYDTPVALPMGFDWDALIEMMPDVVAEMHWGNGLLREIDNGLVVSNHTLWTGDGTLPNIDEVDWALADLIARHVAGPEAQIVLAGSGVSHFDQRWIREWLPQTAKRLWHGTCDVGVMRRFYKDINGHDLVDADQRKTHRALEDADCHVEELRAFAEAFRLVADFDDSMRA